MSTLKYNNEVINFLSDQFGMFVHWGLYSVLGGEWKGQRLEQNSLGEGIMYTYKIRLQTITTKVLKEQLKYQLSKTGVDNIRIGSLCGKIYIDTSGVYSIKLYRTMTNEIRLPLVCLQLKQLLNSGLSYENAEETVTLDNVDLNLI